MERIVANGLNVKQTEKLIEDVLAKKEEALRKRRKVNYISYKIYLNTIRKAFNQIKEMENNVKKKKYITKPMYSRTLLYSIVNDNYVEILL